MQAGSHPMWIMRRLYLCIAGSGTWKAVSLSVSLLVLSAEPEYTAGFSAGVVGEYA